MTDTLLVFLTFASWFFNSNSNSSLNNNTLVPYPEGYRTWTHVKTAIIGPQNPGFKRFGGFHHIYANAKAMEGYETGKFPDGAVLVADFLEMVDQEDGNVVEGKRRFIDVMVKEQQIYDSTGGWVFEEFNENSKTERKIGNRAKGQCFDCHATQQKTDFVFSTFRK